MSETHVSLSLSGPGRNRGRCLASLVRNPEHGENDLLWRWDDIASDEFESFDLSFLDGVGLYSQRDSGDLQGEERVVSDKRCVRR